MVQSHVFEDSYADARCDPFILYQHVFCMSIHCYTCSGGHWVGIAPVLDGKESVTTTVHGRQQVLEFQKRTPADDAKAKFLGTQPGGTLPSYATQVGVITLIGITFFSKNFLSTCGKADPSVPRRMWISQQQIVAARTDRTPIVH